jgi:glycosyltransferase involved in cell wall biosynthesis
MSALALCTPHCGVSPETTSGGETYERELLTRLGRDGVHVELILARGKPHPIGVPNWTVHRFSIRRGLRWWVAPFVVPPAIHRVHRRVGFDLLRVHSLRFIGPGALWARRRWRLDVPSVAHHHHLDADPLNRVIEKRVVEAYDRVIVGSEFARRQLAESLGVRTDHVAVAPYGVDAQFAPRRRAPTCWRVRPGRRPRRAVLRRAQAAQEPDAAARHLGRRPARGPGARLLIAGGGPLLPELRRRAARLGLGDRVGFTGYVPEAEKAEHFNLADVFVFPSALEGFGLAVGEAMSSGLPVVASDRGSIPELLVDGEGGFLCDPARPAQFVEALLRLLRDAPLRAKQGAANVERVDRWFRWERCVATTRAQYESAVEAWRARPASAP